MKKRFSRLFAALAVFCLTLGLFTNVIPAQAATVWRDVSTTHWAAGPVYSWTSQGLVGGYNDGTFRPNQPMTRAEFITFVNRGFGFREMAEISFADVKSNAWFAGDIRKAVAHNYAAANEAGLFEPNKPISRLESMTMLYKVLRLQPNEQDHLSGFKDAATLTGMARDVMNTAVAEGYIGGYTDNTVRPGGTLTRAEMIAILSRVVGTRYAAAGAFGPDLGTAIVNGNVTIPVTGVTLRNTLVKGDLYITEGVGDGEVTLNSVKVEGRTIFAGGGGHSINNTGTTELPYVIIADPNGDVHVVFMDDATSNLISWQSGGTYDSTSGQNRPSIQLSTSIPAGSTVKFVGSFDVIDVAAPDITVEMGEGSQSTTVQVLPSATGSTFALGGTVTTVQLNAEISVTIGETATVTTIVASETAAGSSVTISGAVTDLQTSAPLVVELEEGATLTSVVLEAGAAGTSLATAEGVTSPAVTAPADLTWDNNGTEQTGSTTTPTPPSGSGGGTLPPPPPPAPQVIGVVVKDHAGSTLQNVSFDAANYTVDLTQLDDSVRIQSVEITASPANATLTLVSVMARSQSITGFTDVSYTCPANISVDALMGDYGVLIELLTNDSFDQDVSLGTLRAILGETLTINGTLNTTPAAVTVNLGTGGQATVPTQWVTATITGNVIDVTINSPQTRLAGNLHTVILGISTVNLGNTLPTRIAVSSGSWFDPNDETQLAGFKSALSALVGPSWDTMTLGDLVGETLYFQMPDGTEYTVEF